MRGSVNRLLVISTWFVGDETGEESIFPQMGMPSSTLRFQRVYWQCIWLFFRSARAFNPHAELVLFINKARHPLLEEFGPSLADLEVDLRCVEFRSRPPQGFTETFGNQLYIVDIVRDIAGCNKQDAVWLVLDSDCLIVKPLDALAEATAEHRILTMDCGLPSDENINGLTQQQLGRIAFEMGLVAKEQMLPYYGGEIYAATQAACVKLTTLLDEIMATNIKRWREGRLAIKEEAHLLSLAYVHMGLNRGTANHFIRRIWTTFKYHTACESDLDLPIWHVPAEKRLGFHRMYHYAMKHPRQFEKMIQNSNFKGWAAKQLGIPRRTLRKGILDLLEKLAQKVRG
jgi:hypothetical protein